MWQWGECRVDSDELMHYGVKGQKHGIRRYQNEDGTLTPEGIERYGNKKDYSKKDDGVLRTLAKSSFIGRNTLSRYVANKTGTASEEYARQAKKSRKSASELAKTDPKSAKKLLDLADKQERKSNKLKERSEAQKAANSDRQAYEDHTSTKKLIAQDLLMGKYAAQNYRHARARGSGRLRALFETGAGATPLSTALAMHGNKKKYGKHVVLSEQPENDYTANGMDD